MKERIKNHFKENRRLAREEAAIYNLRMNYNTASRLKSRLLELEEEREELKRELKELRNETN